MPWEGSGGGPRLGAHDDVVVGRFSERTVEAASLMASNPFERAESWQSPEMNTAFVLVLFNSWDDPDGDNKVWDEGGRMEERRREEEGRQFAGRRRRNRFDGPVSLLGDVRRL
jgi:hypothetical protein